MREQRAYRECIEQVKLADNYGFNTVLVRRAPLPRRSLALPRARGRHRRADAGHQEHPPRLRRHAVAVRLHAPDPRRREGGGRRRAVRRPRRVGHRPFDADGADRVPRRSRQEPRRVEGSDRDHRRGVEDRALLVGFADVPVPRARRHAQAVPGSAPAGVDGGDVDRLVRDRRAASVSACCRSRSCSRST